MKEYQNMKMNISVTKGLLLILSSLLLTKAALASDNIRFIGALVKEPCTIQPGDEDVELDFGTIVDKYLYTNQRTLGKYFQIHLVDCDISIGKSVTTTFTGVENLALPGLLALETSSLASGIAIGMETQSGKPLPLNRAGDKLNLVDGSNTIHVKAYIQGEPEALSKRNIVRGSFSSMAIFSLEYE